MTVAGKNGIGNTTSIVLGDLPLVGVLPGGDEDGVSRVVTASHPFIKAGDIPFLDFPAWSTNNQQVYLRGIWCTDGQLNIEVSYLGVEDLDVSQFLIGVAIARSVGYPGAVARAGLPNMGPNRQLRASGIFGNAAHGAIASGNDAELVWSVGANAVSRFCFPAFGGGTPGLCLTGWGHVGSQFRARVINVTGAPISVSANALSMQLISVNPRNTPPSTIVSTAGGSSSAGPEDYYWVPQTGPLAEQTIIEAGVVVDIPTNAKLPDVPVGMSQFQAFTWRGLPTPGLYGIDASGFGATSGGFQLVPQSLVTSGSQGVVPIGSVIAQAIRRLYPTPID